MQTYDPRACQTPPLYCQNNKNFAKPDVDFQQDYENDANQFPPHQIRE